MKITVLNGSPKGKKSATMQYVHFIAKKFPENDLKVFDISQSIKKIEGDEGVFREIINEIESSDGVLWAFPLYYLLVHSGYKRFIELIFERGVRDVFKDKYTAALSTSIKFFDHTAHNYINAICDDLEMNFTGSFSAGMYDLMKEDERERLLLFAGDFFEVIERKYPTSKRFGPLTDSSYKYVPGKIEKKVDVGDKKVVIVSDLEDGQDNLRGMLKRVESSFSTRPEVINLHDIDIKGGCLGCLRCGYDYTCAYDGKDGFIEFYSSKIMAADILIFAGAIRDRYLSSRWKLFFDRSFFNTHTPILRDKQIGFVISGPLSQLPNLREIMEGYFECQWTNVVDFVTDEYNDSTTIDALIDSMVERLLRFSEKSYIKPKTFLGVGGTKVFRDDIWGKLRFPFQADHRFYKKNGVYDFPQKGNLSSRIQNRFLILLTKIPAMRREIYYNRMKDEMIKPLVKIVESK